VTEQRRHSEHAEEVLGHLSYEDHFGAVAHHQRASHAVPCRHSLERLSAPTPIVHIARRAARARNALRRVRIPQSHELLWLRVRQRAQEDALNQAEDGGSAADAQRQSENRHQGEPRLLAQDPRAISEIGP
jgi:hypothetical protein